ncbi:MAG: hypothetical protein COB85_02665 [Bacteroidetes bacterium]|nr:MAG: hypothetical protein COB85_02665 [Bacteroidota bacterium]
MGLKAALSKPFARLAYRKVQRWANTPLRAQERVFQKLLTGGVNTIFGRDHDFANISNYEDFKKAVPIRDYEGLSAYIDKIIEGEKDVLWRGRPIYLCKTSGTTSGVKYIPITKESMSNHIDSARNALLCYIAESGNTDFINGKMIFLQGSPILDKSGAIPIGRLSGIVANHVPRYLLKNRMPTYSTNTIDDWETKVDAIVEETANENMTLISGIPSWVQMYFEKLLEKTGKNTVEQIFPKFSLFVHGGVNFEPYRSNFLKTIGKKIDTIETYPASEGFIAFQDSQKEEGLLLVVNSGIFYEFIPAQQFGEDKQDRISLADVEIGVNYAIILNTNAGLWGYAIGDTIRFVSTSPYRILVTGRIKHYISAFGEHVIAEEVEGALEMAARNHEAKVIEFHVAPQVQAEEGLPYHEWFIEFATEPDSMDDFSSELDELMQNKNIYYQDLIKGRVLQTLKITQIRKDGFIGYMKSKGKLGGQNKVARLSDDRILADELAVFRSNS